MLYARCAFHFETNLAKTGGCRLREWFFKHALACQMQNFQQKEPSQPIVGDDSDQIVDSGD